MKIQVLALTLVLALFVTCSAQARLGETLDQLQARLGPPAPTSGIAQVLVNGKWYPFGQILNFAKEGWSIQCIMVNGACAKITYQKNAPFTDDDINTILTNESQGSSWAKSVSTTTIFGSIFLPTFHMRQWARADGASAQIVDKSFTLTTVEYTKASDAATAQGNADAQKKMPNL